MSVDSLVSDDFFLCTSLLKLRAYYPSSVMCRSAVCVPGRSEQLSDMGAA
jgi:hypothetical protein